MAVPADLPTSAPGGSPDPLSPMTAERTYTEDIPLTSEPWTPDEPMLTSEPPAAGRVHVDESWTEELDELTEPLEV